ncbi:2-polyprenyl-3-methyl-6-methoxy-1,4-benzoquinone monooxygenase [Rhodocyclus gracilis]|uniref:3-demethoxyubiquinol 3-hydroxylase n=1 Tax=Rhodocyclus tenuis TaxID=1066 RepID=A0A6L5JZI7_RHOTE|nr:2-polyprenyl-3-methyl-6-methoxy-1,4-benzoquinone monooxygenase [Rhodocyclus gracilis]MQY52262.1 2-polyprenyl-3-methyl-6-methoxy-1,4-benzoquinone monooxygenase [Rhodocyclus gracilis]
MADRFIIEFDRALRTVFASSPLSRPMPGADVADVDLSDDDRRHVAALMRVNHCGEVCAQALYQGQAITSRQPALRAALEKAGREEVEHLAWTERRLSELGGRTSVLNPLFYLGALSMGVLSGAMGDAWNLGFLAETERQVELHLARHLAELPEEDARSRAILAQMSADEIAHAHMAVGLGGRELPSPVKAAMRSAAKVMTGAAYRL